MRLGFLVHFTLVSRDLDIYNLCRIEEECPLLQLVDGYLYFFIKIKQSKAKIYSRTPKICTWHVACGSRGIPFILTSAWGGEGTPTKKSYSYSNNTLISTWKNDFKGMLEWEVSIFQQVNWYWQRSGFMKSHQSRQQCGLAAAGPSLSSHPAQEDAAPLIRWQQRR